MAVWLFTSVANLYTGLPDYCEQIYRVLREETSVSASNLLATLSPLQFLCKLNKNNKGLYGTCSLSLLSALLAQVSTKEYIRNMATMKNSTVTFPVSNMEAKPSSTAL